MYGRGLAKAMVAMVLAIGLARGAGRDVVLGVHGGLSWPLDEGTDELNTGFTVGASGYLTLIPNLLAGLGVSYNRWGVDEEELINEIEGIIGGDVDGAVHMVEIMPTVRLTVPRLLRSFDIFGQFGIGVYIRTEQVEVEGTGTLGELISGKPLDDTDGRLGMQVGPGVSYGFLNFFGVELSGLYNLLFEEGPRSQYITLRAGLTVTIPRREPKEK
jgi:hypothetical protein